jgi:aminoglycoside 6-adenylyltransferase
VTSVLNEFQNDQVITKLREWALTRTSIWAMLLTSSRANPHGLVDALSDYDIILVVDDIRPYYQDRSWLADFGEVLVTYWDPIYQSPDTGLEVFSNVVQYVNDLRIDFTLWPIGQVRKVATGQRLPPDLDVGYTVLLDKDRLTAQLKPPTYTAYIPEPPTKEIFDKVVEDFYSDVPHVAKCLLRDELMPAKWCLEYDMKHLFLRQMLEWHMELDHQWSLPVGALGKGLKKRLPPALWTALEETYTGAGLQANWEALFKMLNLFREVGEQVATSLGFEFPNELHRRVMIFLHDYRAKGAVLLGR